MKYSDKINFVSCDDKKLLGGIQMNTKTFEQFDVMTDEALSTVEGGNQVAFETGGADWYGYVTYCRDGIHVTPWPYVCPEKRGKK